MTKIEISCLASSSAGNAYVVSDGATSLLLDCGIPAGRLREMLNFRMSSLGGCLLSHEHGDHSRGIQCVIGAGVDVWTSKGSMAALGLPFGHHRLHLAEAGRRISVGTWTIVPFATVHDAAEPLGFFLSSGDEKLLFATDTAYIANRFSGLTHIMIECNYQQDILDANVAAGLTTTAQKNRLLFSHFGLAGVLEFFRVTDISRLREVWLLHLSDGNSDAVDMQRAVAGAVGRAVRVLVTPK